MSCNVFMKVTTKHKVFIYYYRIDTPIIPSLHPSVFPAHAIVSDNNTSPDRGPFIPDDDFTSSFSASVDWFLMIVVMGMVCSTHTGASDIIG